MDRTNEPNTAFEVSSATPPRVLVVDDESTIRIALRRFFTRMGWDVEEAGDGGRALEMILRDRSQRVTPPYSLVVSDLRMPGLSGIELHERIEKDCPEVLPRLVFSTGDVVSEEAADFARETSCEIIEKPFEFAKLRATIDRILGR
ncbi:MAG TPA: response regulator [Gemmatimonadaceae bacterium]|nr:response regulator [Gemmatimonadaceae bacterium]